MLGGIIRFVLGGDSKPLEDAANKGKQSLAELREEYGKNASSAGKWVGALVAAGAAITVHLINNAREAIDEQAALARQLNTTAASMAVLERAADLVGIPFEKVQASARTLSTRLAAAAQSAGAERDALNKLHLQAEELANLPLDERIAAINAAMDQYVPKTEQAAIASQLFGREAGLAILQLDADAIAEAAEEARVFGVAVSEIDAAKIDMANDAFSRLKMANDGFWNQVAIQVAPILQGIGDEFYEMAKDGQDASSLATKAVNWITETVYFLADAIEVVKRTFQVLGQGVAVLSVQAQASLLALIDSVVTAYQSAYNWIASAISNLPGVKIEPMNDPAFLESVRATMEIMKQAVDAGIDDIQKTLNKPMPSESMRKWVEDAKAKADEMAKAAAAKSKGEAGEGPVHVEDDPKAAQLREAIANKLQALQEAYMTELQLLSEKTLQEQEVLKQAYEQKLLTEQEFRNMSLKIAGDYEDQRTKIQKKGEDDRKKAEQQALAAKYQQWKDILGGISVLMNSESRKLFEIGKAAAIASAIVNTHQGITKALAQGGFFGKAMAAVVAAQGFASVAAIRRQSFSGGDASANPGGQSNTEAVNSATTPVGGQTASAGMATTIHLHGENYSQSAVRALIEQINESTTNGGRLVLA